MKKEEKIKNKYSSLFKEYPFADEKDNHVNYPTYCVLQVEAWKKINA